MSTVLRLRLSLSLPRQKVDRYNPTGYNMDSPYVDPSDHQSIQPTLCPSASVAPIQLSLSLSLFLLRSVSFALNLFLN